ncbi:RidA family protein [Brucella cytisi]|uniref:RidA family protein n=1 Tax=Brucella cytisi TaxID=407152 RepID=UPI0035DBE125
MMGEIESRLNKIGLRLPDGPVPSGHYSTVTIHNGIAYIAGQVSRLADDVITGPVNRLTSPDKLKLAAHVCILRALSALTTIEDDYEIQRILFLRGYINAAGDFTGHSAVLDHASILLRAIFGERGHHARSAIGVASLPSAGLMEIELIVAVLPKSTDERARDIVASFSTGDLT